MIRLIAAIDQNRGIAKKGVQPWHIPEDSQYFDDITKQSGGNVLMGKTTLQIIGKALAGRTNFVMTHEETLPFENVQVVHRDIGAFFQNFGSDIWVIGGEEIYKQTIDFAGELYLTTIDFDFGCDQFFPEYEGDFKMAEQSPPRKQDELQYHFEIWRRNI